MISNLEKKIAFRYLKARKTDGFLNVISIFSFIGISLGVAVLIIVMSVMNGFRTELTSKIIGFNSHLILKPYDTSIDKETKKKLSAIKEINYYLNSNNAEGIIIDQNLTKGVLLRGYSSEDFKKLEILKGNNFNGSFSLEENSISLGAELAFSIGADIGDEINIISPKGIQTIVGNLPAQETFIISSIFESGMVEFDQSVAFVNLKKLESFFGIKSETNFLEIYVNEPIYINKIKLKIENIFKEKFYIITWEDLNRSLFSALKVERNVMFIILFLIIIVGAFNIISGLTILVKNKTREIAILKSIGIQNNSIKKIFFLIGLIIGTTATFFGIFLGIIFSYNVEKIRFQLSEIFNISLFPEEIYFLSKIPYEINFISISIIAISSILITCIVSFFPARKATQIDPVKALKYD